MPYIKQEQRDEIETGVPPATKGELTYVIYRAMLDWMTDAEVKNFDRYADAIAAAECAKLEFYRRHVALYEGDAILRNGDVYSS